MVRYVAVMLGAALLATLIGGWLWRARWPGPPPNALQTFRQQEVTTDAEWRKVILSEGPTAGTAADVVDAL